MTNKSLFDGQEIEYDYNWRTSNLSPKLRKVLKHKLKDKQFYILQDPELVNDYKMGGQYGENIAQCWYSRYMLCNGEVIEVREFIVYHEDTALTGYKHHTYWVRTTMKETQRARNYIMALMKDFTLFENTKYDFEYTERN